MGLIWQIGPAIIAAKWPDFIFEIETDTSVPTWPDTITKLTLTHPDSPIIVTYTYEQDQDQADITAGGLHQASYRDMQSALPVIRWLRDFTSKPKRHKTARTDYDRGFELIEAGNDPAKVKEEFLATVGGNAKAFHAAMYRRREKKKRSTIWD